MVAATPRDFRHRVGLDAEVLGGGMCFSAEVRDLSLGGMRLRGSTALEFRERVGVGLYGKSGFLIGLPGEVRWVRKEVPGVYFMGVAFAFGSGMKEEMKGLMWRIETGQVEGALRHRRTVRVNRPF